MLCPESSSGTPAALVEVNVHLPPLQGVLMDVRSENWPSATALLCGRSKPAALSRSGPQAGARRPRRDCPPRSNGGGGLAPARGLQDTDDPSRPPHGLTLADTEGSSDVPDSHPVEEH